MTQRSWIYRTPTLSYVNDINTFFRCFRYIVSQMYQIGRDEFEGRRVLHPRSPSSKVGSLSLSPPIASFSPLGFILCLYILMNQADERSRSSRRVFTVWLNPEIITAIDEQYISYIHSASLDCTPLPCHLPKYPETACFEHDDP